MVVAGGAFEPHALVAVLSGLATPHQQLLDRLWSERRLQLRSGRALDDLDELAARLGALQLSRDKSVCLVLPTTNPDRGPMILATALLSFWWDRKSVGDFASLGRPVLYFGNSVGIRDDLGQTTIRGLGLDLKEALGQTDGVVHRGPHEPGRSTQVRAGLPRIVTVYGPADPSSLIERFQPPWVVVDLAGDHRAPWLSALVAACARRAVPFLAWTDNPLSQEVEELRAAGLMVALPTVALNRGGFWESLQTIFRPLLLTGKTATEINGLLRAAAGELLNAARLGRGSSLVGDATRAHWALLRTLETLPCPADHYEANAVRYWGLQTIGALGATCASFRRVTEPTYPEAARALAAASGALESATETLMDAGNPLWLALASICVEGAGEGTTLSVWFGSRGKRALFSEALLSRFGISETDLATIGVSVQTLTRSAASRSAAPRDDHRGVLASPPQASDWRGLRTLLEMRTLDVVAYPASAGRLRHSLDRWAAAWDPVPLVDLVTSAGGVITADDTGPPPPRIIAAEAAGVAEGHLREPAVLELPDGALDNDEELERLLGATHGDVFEESRRLGTEQGDADLSTVTTAIAVTFLEGWHADYANEQTVMLVSRTGLAARVQDVPATSLKVGDEVVAIHGQQRQSLYELLIARLHRNPAIELHLALLERWQQDLEEGYDRWVRRGLNLEDLLGAMQAGGSQITSTSGVRMWVIGRTLAPQDPEDVRRLGEILELEFILSNYARISSAASRLRGLHRGLALRLNNWLEGEAARGDAEDDPLIDAETGIRFSDFRSSLLHLHVASVSVVGGLFLRGRLGFVEKGRSA